MRLHLLAVAVLVLADPCDPATGPSGPLAQGTWGGENAGAVVNDTELHVHIGCTYGDAARPDLRGGNFEVTGRYNVTAHPVDLGVFHPARFVGRVRGDRLTLTVTLTDTQQQLGPVSIVLGQEPRMGPCPICRTPAER